MDTPLTCKKIHTAAQKAKSQQCGNTKDVPTNIRNETRTPIVTTTAEHYIVGFSQLSQTRERTWKPKKARGKTTSICR